MMTSNKFYLFIYLWVWSLMLILALVLCLFIRQLKILRYESQSIARAILNGMGSHFVQTTEITR